MLLRPAAHTSVWTSTCSPTSGSIGVGTGTGVILIHETPSGPTTQLHPFGDWSNRALPTASDVLALEFLSDATLAAGQRDGAVELLDTRELSRGRKPALALRHPSAVTHLRRVDEHRVVVNGLKSSVCIFTPMLCAGSNRQLRMFDLRYAHQAAPMRGYLSPTRPLLVYEHSNDFRIGLGFDVDLASGLVAAGRISVQSLFVSCRFGSS